MQPNEDATNLSLAVWYKNTISLGADDTGTKAQLEIHYNLWDCAAIKDKDGHKVASFLDIGLMISDFDDIEELYMFLPFGADEGSVTDIGCKLDVESTVLGIFNEPLDISDNNKPFIELSNKKTEGSIWVRPLVEGEYTLSNAQVARVDESKIITIPATVMNSAKKPELKGGKLYFRLRVDITNVKPNPFIYEVSPADRKVLSGFEYLKYIDFRVNEARNLPSIIRNMMTYPQMALFNITQIHFLLATSVRYDFISGHRDFNKSRMLESHLWKGYVGRPIPEHMLIYHWKTRVEPEGVRDFNAFAKFRIRESTIVTTLKYLGIAFLIGAIGSYIAAWFTTIFGGVNITCEMLAGIELIQSADFNINQIVSTIVENCPKSKEEGT